MNALWKVVHDRAVAGGIAAFIGGFAVARWMNSESPPESPKVETAIASPVKINPATETVSTETAETAPAPQKSVRQPIRDALAGDDPLASAARMVAWLDTTTAETFRKLGEEPQKFPGPHFSGFDHEFRAAYFKAIAERWMALDPEGALLAMQRVQAELNKKYMNGELLGAAATLRPDLVLEKLPLENKGGYLEPYARAALSSLAARDLKAARLFAERWTDPKLQKSAATAIATGLAQNDPLAVVSLAAAIKDQSLYSVALHAAERIGPGMVRQVLQAAGDRFGPYAISSDFLLRHPDLAADMPDIPAAKNTAFYISDEALAAADRLSPEQRERLLASYDSLPSSARENAAVALVCSWARTDPRKAAEWAMAHGHSEDGNHPANNPAQQVFLRWIDADADAALAWWRVLPSSPLRNALGTNASTFLAEDGRLDVALEIFQPNAETTNEKDMVSESKTASGALRTVTRGGTAEQSATTQLAQILAERDPGAAGKWFATLPASVASEQTAHAVVNGWYARSPEAVARWIETLPAGASRDQAARAFIQQAAQTSPAGAAEWVETVSDSELRRKAAEWVFWQMKTDDPSGARQWLSGLGGIDADWQARILRRSP